MPYIGSCVPNMIETADVGPPAPHLFLTLHHLVAQAAFLLHVLCASLCMHFSKTYQQLLLTLPPELRDSAIEYRKLKKLINQVVTELTSLGEHSDIFCSLTGLNEYIGLAPEILHDVLQPGSAELTAPRTVKVNEQEVEVCCS